MRAARATAALILITAIAACDDTTTSGGRTVTVSAVADGTLATRAKAIARQIGLALPPSATVEFAELIDDGPDNAARLIVTMTPAEWDRLRTTLSLAAADLAEEQNFHLGMDEGAWQPGAAKGLTSVQLPWRDDTELLNIGAAPTDSGRTRVFLFWYQL